MTDWTTYLPILNILKPRPLPGVQRLLAKLPSHQTYNANLGIIWTTVGASTAVYLVWQYINRSPSQILGNETYWSGLDYLIDRLTHSPTGTLTLPNPPDLPHLLDPRRILTHTRPIYHGTTSQSIRARVRRFMTTHFIFHFGDGAHHPWTLLTSCLSHQDWRHLTANLTAFLEFSRVLAAQEQMQPRVLLALMGCCALGGKLGFMMQQSLRQLRRKQQRQQQRPNTDKKPDTTQNPNANTESSLNTAPNTDGPYTQGLSAITQGLGVAATCMYPWQLVAPLGGPVRLPLWLATSTYLLFDLWTVRDAESTIGHAAHLGGALTGYLFWNLVLR